MPFGGLVLAGTIGSSIIGSQGSKGAAKTQAEAAKYSADLQSKQFEETRSDQQPWLDAGKFGLQDLMKGLGPDGAFSTPFSGTFKAPTLAEAESTPGYEFAKQQGELGILRGQSASGGAFTGGTLKSLDAFNNGLAQQGYQQTYNNKLTDFNTQFNTYNTNQSNLYNKLASLAGVGQTAATQIGQFGQTAAANEANLITGGANATAAGQVGASNAWAGGLGGLTNSLSGYMQLQNLMKNQPVSYDQAHLPAGQSYNVPYQPPYDNSFGDFGEGL